MPHPANRTNPFNGCNWLARSLTLCLLVLTNIVHAQYVQDRDLISLHYDHAPDRDDGHAAVAALAVVRSLGIQPHVVSGAYGQNNRNQYQPGAEAVMSETWGSEWVNAHGNWQSAVNTTATRWLATLDAGGDIWIAEGGQSDFTADVVRRIQSTRSSIDTENRINTVQHSVWNELQANQTDLNFTRNNTNYIKIDDGNNVNSTADLNEKSTAFVNLARASQYGDAWDAAFSYLNPNTKLDFSDTVELLHILGIGKNTIATVSDFGAVYLNNSEIVQPDTPTPWSDSYSVDGQCYCDSSYDHGLDSITVATPAGVKTVPEVCADISARLGTGSFNNRVYYNTVQCGFPPRNNASDELSCPGIPRATGDYTGYRCQQTGASWNLEIVYAQPEPPVEPEEPVEPVEPVQPAEPVEPDPVEPAQPTTPSQDTPPENNDSESNGTDPFPVCSATVSDPDGDGYAWENNQTCTVSRGTEQTNDQNVALTDFPNCSANATDPDGDGYAWENNQSCVITVNTQTAADNSQPINNGSVDLLSLFPACSSTVADPEGDGFGWENNQSCVITNTPSATVNATVTPDNNTINLLDFYPACTSAADDNGDGYGWEFNRTCVIVPNDSVTTPNTNEATNPLNFFPPCSSGIVDFNGDGYGWENNQSCVVTGNTNADPTNNTATPDSVAGAINLLDFYPACSSAAIDHNGDGFEWENNKSCVVVNSDSLTANNTQTSATNEINLLDFFPACSAAAVDSTGDGYGWENNQTCVIVSGTSQTTPSTVEPENSIDLLDYFPACSDGAVDLDGDGYEWENNQTCVIITDQIVVPVFPTCSSAVVDDDFDGFGWEDNQSCAIRN